MSALPREFPHPFQSSRLLVWEPPYRMPRYLRSTEDLADTHRRGSVLVLGVDGTVAGAEVRCALLTLTRVAPWTSAMLVAKDYVPAAILLELARRVGFHSCDAVLPLAPNDGRALQVLLGAAAVDPEVVVSWAETLRPEVGRVRGELLQYLRGDDPGDGHRSLRSALRGAGLPAPSAWSRVLSLLPTMIRLQDGSTTVAEAAYAAGFADAASLSRAIYRLVGLRPIEVRGMYGWKWIAYRWLRQAGTHESASLMPSVGALRRPATRPLRSLAKAV